MSESTTGRPHRVRRAEAQAEIAAEADRIRYVRGRHVGGRMTPRPVGPGRAEWIAGLTPARCALIASTDAALATLAGPCTPEEHAEALATVRTALAFAEAWAVRGQRRLDEERQRGAALAAAVRADCESREEEGVGGMNTLPVELRAALVAYEGRGE